MQQSIIPEICVEGRWAGYAIFDDKADETGSATYPTCFAPDRRFGIIALFGELSDVAKPVFLISCVSEKRATAAAARDIYISAWFGKARRYVERRGARWFILSAKYGLVDPGRFIEPYEKTLNAMPISERRQWSEDVFSEFCVAAPETRHVVFLAGARYRKFLAERLQKSGITVEAPTGHMRIGEQLSWLGQI